MKEVDARGLSCPEPLMMTDEAIKEGAGEFTVLVTEPFQRTNVEKFARSKGKTFTSGEKDGYYTVTVHA
ncbi:MAG: sulfurtransferase TusA family protein [Lachnospiraceae bacterium]|nr:sulfurtransferase TusA family protein [Lachnospiraceae bacterium]